MSRVLSFGDYMIPVLKYSCNINTRLRRNCVFVNRFFTNVTNTRLYKDTSQHKPSSTDDEEFITIYSYPRIKYFAILNKAIRIPTFAIACGLPVGSTLFIAGIISTQQFTAGLIIGSCLVIYLNLIAVNLWRTVGFLYVNRNLDKLKVSYISYWGARQNVIIPVSEIMAFSDLRRSPTDLLYRKIKTFNSSPLDFKNTYKVDIHGGFVTDPDKFHKIFGILE